MITKRNVYQIQEKVDSAIGRLEQIIYSGRAISTSDLHEVITRDLSEAKEQIEYVMEMAS